MKAKIKPTDVRINRIESGKVRITFTTKAALASALRNKALCLYIQNNVLLIEESALKGVFIWCMGHDFKINSDIPLNLYYTKTS